MSFQNRQVGFKCSHGYRLEKINKKHFLMLNFFVNTDSSKTALLAQNSFVMNS